MKYSISVSKKVQTYPYENIEVSYSAEYDSEDVPPDVAYHEVSSQVNEWINMGLKQLGLKERKA